MKKKISSLLIIMTLLIIPLVNHKMITLGHTSEDSVRVGLKAYYEQVPTIHIKNETIVVGYELEDLWQDEMVLESSTGFEFYPANEAYFISNEFVTKYNDAKEITEKLSYEGIEAFAGSVSLGMWKVYIPLDGFKEEDYSDVLNRIDGKYGVTYHQGSDNKYRVRMNASEYSIIFENSFDHPQFITTDASEGINVLDLGTRQYRGKIEIGRYGKEGITAINILPIEEYLYGVVPGEIIPSWPMESLKAQAVAARTYAMYYKDVAPKYGNEPYTLCDTTNSQVYYGYSSENENTNKAIDRTKGEMVYYNHSIIPTYFFSTSGGHTENSENVWSATVPYLTGVPDIYELEPERRPWVKVHTSESIEEALNRYNVNIGTVLDIEVDGMSNAGRVMTLNIIGSEGDYAINKETIRVWLGLNSRKFKLVKENTPEHTIVNVQNSHNKDLKLADDLYVINGNGEVNKVMDAEEQFIILSGTNIDNYPTLQSDNGEFIFVGQGWGHGVGLSQSGAKGMALHGYTYKEILEYYYTGTQVK
ncbi:stage II sporulation protein D [Natranaerovirga hydrolytica]|uniref:Stage II sporulation protein D n=1 Tax=Natranaerovirga hydrolytica TaxID=680378 RepID=A0A4R1MLV6_9FIRM|nr:SpoIID/LytB domain-containing protein [Natranaerovirga hydrolytica]TCK92852.1 stage II sporulation protein D [Natranaerovirga hydrolytica]